ncbi:MULTISPECIES: SRPBCC family protein [unclassified Streptomyces]|uniref:type II toxin-antitoxin system RatA family toxin n=1 Tax=unclassified Streptomyces TaxID=2593676 RepID=UPI0033AADD9E
MRSIHFHLKLPTGDGPAAFDAVVDFTRYPSLSPDVRSVVTQEAATPGEPRTSDWVMNFRRGLMSWTERERLDRDRLRAEFAQLDGDFEDFRGVWQLIPGTGGVEVMLDVTYDFGVESLVGIMDPIAERVIKRSTLRVLTGLFGEVEVLAGGEALVDFPAAGSPAPLSSPSIRS